MIDEKRIKRFIEGAKEAFKEVDNPTFTFPMNILSAYELATSIEELLKELGVVEPKTGHWIESKCLDECFWVCSECNFPSEAIIAPKLYKYCPNCGTKMKEQAVK